MSILKKPPHVVLRIYRERDAEILRGFLLRTPDGRYWALPEAATHEKNPFHATAYQLESSQLEEQPSSDPDRRTFLYRAVLDAPA